MKCFLSYCCGRVQSIWAMSPCGQMVLGCIVSHASMASFSVTASVLAFIYLHDKRYKINPSLQVAYGQGVFSFKLSVLKQNKNMLVRKGLWAIM